VLPTYGAELRLNIPSKQWQHLRQVSKHHAATQRGERHSHCAKPCPELNNIRERRTQTLPVRGQRLAEEFGKHGRCRPEAIASVAMSRLAFLVLSPRVGWVGEQAQRAPTRHEELNLLQSSLTQLHVSRLRREKRGVHGLLGAELAGVATQTQLLPTWRVHARCPGASWLSIVIIWRGRGLAIGIQSKGPNWAPNWMKVDEHF
jgi:hypothetical protein